MSFFNPINFRNFSYVEGVSFLLLLFVAMPLKYLFAMPFAVTIVGSLHGIIFVAYLVFMALTAVQSQWTFFRVVLGFLAGVLPFGPFVFHAFAKQGNSVATADN
jgi:integral membrane protein